MKALIASGSNKLSLDESHDQPVPGDGEVLVKVAATPLQPSDRLNVKGDFPATQFPTVPGRNYAGTVVVAPESSKWLGKRVYGTSGHELSFTRDGTHAEFVTVPEYGLTEIPSCLDWVQAALVGLPWTTSWLMLNRAQAKKGDIVAVIGAGGNVGSAVSEMARSSLFECQVLKVGRGAKYDVDTSSDSSMSGLKEKTDGKGPDVVIDTTGDLDVLAAAIKVLGKKGRLAFISTGSSHGTTNTELSLDFKNLYRFEQSIIGCNSVDHDMAETVGWMNVLSKGFESGDLTPPKSDDPRVRTIGLHEAVDAYRQLNEGLKDLVVIVADG